MKKFPKTIQTKFKDLQSIRLQQDEKDFLHKQLLSELNLSVSDNKKAASVLTMIPFYIRELTKQISLKPIGMMILLAGIIVGPGIATVSAARASLPGDTLYPLKRSLESVELSLAFSEKRKATKEIDQIANRLTEINRITQEQTPSPERQQKIVLALEELKKNTDTVKKRLESTKEEGDSENTPTEAVEIAKIIEEKTASYKEDLKISVEQLGNEVEQDSEDIQLALSAVQEVAINALNIIAVNHEDGGEEVSKEDLKQSVEEQLITVKEQIENLTKRLADVNLIVEEIAALAVSSDSTTNEEESTEETTEESEEETPEEESLLASIQSTIDSAIQEQIQFIEELIELGEFKTALDRLSETKSEVDVLSQNLRLERQLRQSELDALEALQEEPLEEETAEPSEDETPSEENEDQTQEPSENEEPQDTSETEEKQETSEEPVSPDDSEE